MQMYKILDMSGGPHSSAIPIDETQNYLYESNFYPNSRVSQPRLTSKIMSPKSQYHGHQPSQATNMNHNLH